MTTTITRVRGRSGAKKGKLHFYVQFGDARSAVHLIQAEGLSPVQVKEKIDNLRAKLVSRAVHVDVMQTTLVNDVVTVAGEQWEINGATIRERGTDFELRVVAATATATHILERVYPDPDDIPADAEIRRMLREEIADADSSNDAAVEAQVRALLGGG